MEADDSLKLPKSVLNIEGAQANIKTGQLLISSGIPSLDDLLGGGLPVGTVLLLQEDRYGTYAKIILKYFLAEGIVNRQSTFIASQDTSTHDIIQGLPAVSNVDSEHTSKNASGDDDKLKIAFMYQNLPTEKGNSLCFAHYYDLTKNMSSDVIEKADVIHWLPQEEDDAPHTFSNPVYHQLLNTIKNQLKTGKFHITDKIKKRSILRIGIHALGSPMWAANDSSGLTIRQNRDLDMFVFCLRALVRSSFATAVVTAPAHLIEKSSLDRCIYSSDIVIKLQTFAGTELESNAVLTDYHGYFHLIKSAAINTFISNHPGSVEYVFKLRRRKFCIEKLHLPPDLSDSTNKNEKPTMGCASTTKHLLEF